MNQIQEQHAVLPTNQFDARLAEELEERVEFSVWSHVKTSETYGSNGWSVGSTQTW